MNAMHSVTLERLQDRGPGKDQLREWLKAGETVELREQDEVLGRIVPHESETPSSKAWPDFAARRRAIFGDRVLEKNALLEAREDSRY